MRFLCRIGWHEWSIWENQKFHITDDLGGNYYVSGQIKTCKSCNKRKVKY